MLLILTPCLFRYKLYAPVLIRIIGIIDELFGQTPYAVFTESEFF